MKFSMSCLLQYRYCIPNLVKIVPVVLEKKMLTHDARRTTDAKPAIGHLSDSGDLKTIINSRLNWGILLLRLDTFENII